VQGKSCASEEGGGELVVVVGPPVAPAVIALAATGPVPHRVGVRVTGVNAAVDGCFDAGDGIVHGREQRVARGCVQGVSPRVRLSSRQPSRARSRSESTDRPIDRSLTGSRALQISLE